MDLPLTGAEATALRACAKREARSKQDVARHAVREYVENPYQTVEEKAAALLHSLVRNHKLIRRESADGFGSRHRSPRVNGRRLWTLSNDQAYELIIEVATGELDEVPCIADRIRRGSEARHR